MASTIDYLLQDSGAMLLAVSTNRPKLTEKGFTEEAYTALVGAHDELKATELAQQKAVKFAEDKTAEQNETVDRITDLLRSVRNAAKSAYEEDARSLALFKIGEKIPGSVKKLRTTCEYMFSIVDERKADLLKSGLVQADVDALSTASDDLAAADAAQEGAKKTQAVATLTRDAAAKQLKTKLTKLRNFVKAAFAKNPEIALQFNPIPKGHGGKGKPGDDEEETPPPDEPTPSAQ
ncbi:MAG: hypothetical protein Q8N83_01620 [Ignavibacteria bacterium]|nr:hypothetical protein [Ignavibacteria bacterium]